MFTNPYISISELNIVLYIANNVKTKDLHNISKILFWSDREHLAKYGHKLSDNKYAVMDYGPCPSKLLDYFKSIKNSKDEYFEINNFIVTPLKNPDMNYISESEKECIDNTITKYDNFNFNDRTEASHGYAYNKAKRDLNRFIDDKDIAYEGGANDELLKYISLT